MKKSRKMTAIILSIAMSASAAFMSPVGMNTVQVEAAEVAGGSTVTEITGTAGVAETQLSGWQIIDEKKYYYVNGAPVTGSYRIGDYWYYFSSKGVMHTGWLTNKKGQKYYFSSKGVRANGLTKIDGTWYYFNSRGVMQTNCWLEYRDRKYYFDANGLRKVGSVKIEGKWYYFDSKGIMKIGWLTGKNGNKYYFDEDGVRAKGLVAIDGNKYFFNSKGIMQTGWVTVSGNLYYLGTDGVLRTGWQEIGGKTYRFNTKGAMLRGWTKDNGKRYYLGDDGVMVKSCTLTISGKTYTFDATGALVANPEPEAEYDIVYHIDDNDTYLQKLTIDNLNPVKYSSNKALTLKNLSVAGYRFEGWYDGQGSSATKITSIPAGTTGTVDLYAHWSEISYKILFDPGASSLVSVDPINYTVSSGSPLPSLSWDGYVFAGWTDDNGKVWKTVRPGTTGNLTLYANWTSNRNQAMMVDKNGNPIKWENPIISFNDEDGVVFFTYEIGKIINVPLYTKKDLGYKNGFTVEEQYTTTGRVTKEQADTVAQTVAKATTQSTSWLLSKEWNDVVTTTESHTNGQVSTYASSTSTDVGWLISNSMSASNGGNTSLTSENGTSTKTHETASVEAEAGCSFAKVKGKYEAGVEEQSTYKVGMEVGANWNATASFDESEHYSQNSTTSSSVSSQISDTYGYGKQHLEGGSETVTRGDSSTVSEANEYATSVTYATAEETSTTKKYSNANAPTGYYRIVQAGTAHVFAIVGYKISTGTYFVYTHVVMDDETYEYMDYSKVSNEFNDYENGVLPFEVPLFVGEYIADMLTTTDDLIVDPSTGIIEQYTGEAKDIYIPQYYVVDNNGTPEAIKINGIEPAAFKNTDITSVSIAKTITEIPVSAFEGCTSLKSISCPGVTNIGNNAFTGCTSLESIDCPAVQQIGKGAFYGCSKLQNFEIGKQVTSIGTNALKGIGKITVTASNPSIVEAAVASEVKSIIIKTSEMEGELADISLHVASSTDYFEFDGGGKTFSGVKIQSDAAETLLKDAKFTSSSAVPLRISSAKCTLNQVTVTTSGYGLVLSADSTDLKFYGTNTIFSETESAILSKSVVASKVNPKVTGKLVSTGNMIVCGTISGESLISFQKGGLITVSVSEFDSLANGTIEWILASDAPAGATIVNEKWTYDLTTTATSDTNEMEGYTLVDTTYVWSDYGPWSDWSNTPVAASDSRQVETRVIPATMKTQWSYSRYYGVGSTGWYYCYPYATGVCQTQEWTTWLDSPLPSEWDGEFTGYGRGYDAYGNYVTGRNGSRWDMWWYNESTRQVEATPAYTQYRYRDRYKIYTYHFEKVEQMESATAVEASGSVSNVKKWVQCVY